jgi:aromatic-L-amino-acid decarboxylase
MTPEEFRRQGYALVDWVARYMTRVGDLPVRSAVAPGDIRALLPRAAPEDPEPFESLISDLDDVVLPGITHWQAPGWFAYFPANASPPSILAELVAAGLGVQGMLWSTSPAVTEIEAHVVDWLVDLLGLPREWKTAVGPGGGVIQMSASDSTHVAHVVARRLVTDGGAATDDVVAYSSAQAHSSIEKGARVAGIRHVRLVDVDERFALRAEALEAAIEHDRADGLVPAIVTARSARPRPPRSTRARDRRDREAARDVASRRRGLCGLRDDLRGVSRHQDGVEQADSYVFNAHKWMFTNFDCSIFWVADRAPLIETLSILPPTCATRRRRRAT